MRVIIDTCNREQGYADLRQDEEFTDERRAKALAKMDGEGIGQIEFWRGATDTEPQFLETWAKRQDQWQKIRP